MFRFVCTSAILLIIFVRASGSTRWDAHRWESEDVSPIWMEYEFDSGAGNREKLRVTNVSVREYEHLPATNETRWQYLEANGSKLLFRAEESTLLLYELDSRFNDSAIENRGNLTVDGRILTFRVARLEGRGRDGREHALVVLCVQSERATLLRWYRLADGNYSFRFFWSWPVQKSTKDMKLVERERSSEPLLLLLLLLLNEDDGRSIDVYGLAIDFSIDAFHFWLNQRIVAEEAFGIEVCSSIYENAVLAVRAANQVALYEYQNTAKESLFRELQTIKSNDLKNSVCFESGYLQFLATSGPEAALFHYADGEFQFSVESEAGFDVSEVRWVESIKLDTYRDERLVLMQLGNGTVIGLAWQGLAFEKVELPSGVLDRIDLSAVTPLPNYGFIVGNRLVRFRGELRNAKHPMRHTAERLLALQRLLNDSLNHQQGILEETEARLRSSYFNGEPITGVWNVSLVNATNAAISDEVIYRAVAIGAANLTNQELRFDADYFAAGLNDTEKKLREIDRSLTSALDLDATGLRFHSDFASEVFASIRVTGKLNVGHLDASTVNNVDVVDARGDSAREPDRDYYAIKGKRAVDRVEGKNATIRRLNGVPLRSIRFGEFASSGSYPKVDFAGISKAAVEGHLLFSAIFWNGSADWDTLMKEIAWKDKPIFVPATTVIQGTLVSDIFEVFRVNDLLYPEEYVPSEGDGSVTVHGCKSFRSLLTLRLENVTALNDLDFEEFVTLHKDNVLKEEITFENLTIVEEFEVDGEVAGLSLAEIRMLNETRKISSDVTFLSLNVLGNVELDALLVNKSPLNLGDLLTKSEEEIEIAGCKTFLGNVGIKSNVTIASGTINGHLFDEFATFDTDQAFPNLTNVSANFTFENATLRAFEKLESFFEGRANSSDCLETIVTFEAPITVDQLSFGKLNDHVSYEEFSRKLNDTLESITVENLNSDIVLAREVTVNAIGGIDFAKFAESFALSSIVNAHAHPYIIDSLETDRLNATLVNGMSLTEINRVKDTVASILDGILGGSATLESLRVAGTIEAASINGNVPERLYLSNETGTVIFNRDVSIRNLTILGRTSGFDISERVSDTVLKTDTEIPIHGHKTFRAINCHRLEATRVNGSPAKNILDPSNQQTLSAVAILNGSTTVLEKFRGTGKIGDVRFHDLAHRFKAMGNRSGFEFHGDVRLLNHVRVKNLYATGSIGGTKVDEFLKTVAFKHQDNLVISASKALESSVAFNDAFLVTDNLNDIDLKKFHEKVVLVDRPFSVRSKIVLKGSAKAEKEVSIESSIETKSIMGVDVNELQRDVMHLDRPAFLQGIVTFAHLNLQSDVTVERLNDLDAKLLIPLSIEQTMSVEVLKCGNLTVDNIDIVQRVNGENFKNMQENTLMTTGSQNLTGRFSFRALVHVRRSFNARLVNGIDPANFVSANSKSFLIGNFLFEGPTFFDESVRALGYLNDVDPIRWEAVAVRKRNPFRQIVSGGWTVVGNVYLEKGALGSDVLNGTNVAEVSSGLASSRLQMDAALSERNANLDSSGEDLSELRRYAEKQIYRFDALDYLQLIEFNSSIASIHCFEQDDLDYLMLSYRTCQMHAYLFTGRKFELVGSVAYFGAVERWTSFRHDRTIYFLASGISACGRSPVNLWKFDRDEFQHVLSLGRDVDAEKMGRGAFPALIGARSSAGINQQLDKYVSLLASDNVDDRDVKMIFRQDPMPLARKRAAYQAGVDRGNATSVGKYTRSVQTLRFQAGPLEKEMLLYYDDELSKDRVFICSNDAKPRKILQTIKAHRPTDFATLRFEGSIETLLVFIENRKNLQIYEYRGIQGFAYLDSIRIDAEKLFVFKIRKHANLVKRHCLALVRDNRLTIFEAKMHGERVDTHIIEAEKH